MLLHLIKKSLFACNLPELSQFLVGSKLDVLLLADIFLPLASLPNGHRGWVFEAPLLGDLLPF